MRKRYFGQVLNSWKKRTGVRQVIDKWTRYGKEMPSLPGSAGDSSGTGSVFNDTVFCEPFQ